MLFLDVGLWMPFSFSLFYFSAQLFTFNENRICMPVGQLVTGIFHPVVCPIRMPYRCCLNQAESLGPWPLGGGQILT